MNLSMTAVFALLKRLADTDGDGKIELGDLPGVIEKASEMVAVGEALVESGRNSIDALLALARRGGVVENGIVLTADDVTARWRASRAGFKAAGDRIREELSEESGSASVE